MKRKEQDKVNGNMIVNVKRGYVDPLEWDHWTGPEKDECIAKWNPGQVNDFYRSFLEMFGVRDQDTEGDGNCFFHALSHVLANTFPRSHQELRAWSVHNMKDTCTEESYSNQPEDRREVLVYLPQEAIITKAVGIAHRDRHYESLHSVVGDSVVWLVDPVRVEEYRRRRSESSATLSASTDDLADTRSTTLPSAQTAAPRNPLAKDTSTPSISPSEANVSKSSLPPSTKHISSLKSTSVPMPSSIAASVASTDLHKPALPSATAGAALPNSTESMRHPATAGVTMPNAPMPNVAESAVTSVPNGVPGTSPLSTTGHSLAPSPHTVTVPRSMPIAATQRIDEFSLPVPSVSPVRTSVPRSVRSAVDHARGKMRTMNIFLYGACGEEGYERGYAIPYPRDELELHKKASQKFGEEIVEVFPVRNCDKWAPLTFAGCWRDTDKVYCLSQKMWATMCHPPGCANTRPSRQARSSVQVN
eukprot:CAMPEP_0184340282 /NCGR_PEP_ID=MMETSP1089-20130417/8960_1 /TAXON_ID=38269 ORGANISM="Gloeochaete wittrockiana, Strain SAG46.84" /NCGR_SAMPLE_ID=MMETSP1089 /ASSEMBLY_ACC=CAM_ASM_000445 /LENGTH=473 /DNA_ID=CAMNT_0026668017 /DNA_START=456 /DNA_END=1879 /DNA_ORIENTATION=+